MSEPLFSKDCPVAAELTLWWADLEGTRKRDASGKRAPNLRGDRAELRRAESLLAIMLTPAFHAAVHRLQAAGLGEASWPNQGERLAAIIGLAAHLRRPDDGTSGGDLSLPEAASNPEQGTSDDRPPVSPIRFRQVLEAQTHEELYLRLRRVLPLVEGRVHLGRLAADVYFWGDGTRKRWVYDYRWPTKTA